MKSIIGIRAVRHSLASLTRRRVGLDPGIVLNGSKLRFVWHLDCSQIINNDLFSMAGEAWRNLCLSNFPQDLRKPALISSPFYNDPLSGMECAFYCLRQQIMG